MKCVKAWLLVGIVLGFGVAPAPAGVVLTEIHYHPVEVPEFNVDGTPLLDLSNDVHEFVEIQNTGVSTVELVGWSLAGGIGYSFSTNTTVAPGEFRVIARDPARLAAVYGLDPATVLGPYSGSLGNGSDTVRLRDAAGKTQDSVKYDSRFPWAQSADALGAQDRFTGLDVADYQHKGRSLQRVSVSWPAHDPANWLASPLSGPTPGGPQAVTRSVPKPIVVAYAAAQAGDGAAVVRANQAVAVTCTYSATNDLSSVTLEYFVDDLNSTAETRLRVPMSDLGSGRYAASIPGQSDRSIVRYRFEADRGDGLEVVSPRTDDPQIAPTAAAGVLEAWHGYFVTPVRTSTNAATYDVFVSTSSLSKMGSNIGQNPNRVTAASATGLPRDVPYVAATAPQWNGTVPGVLAYNGSIWDIQIRYHGSKYHRAASNHSYKVHFPDHDLFNGQSSWFETLHGTEFIEGQKINRLLGLPASKMRRVDWYLNSNANEVHSEQGEYAGEMLDAYHELQQQLNPGSKKEANGEIYKDVGNRDPSQNSVEGPYTRGDEAPLAANAGWSQLDRYAWTFTLQNNHWKGSKPIRDLIEGMWAARGDSPSTHNFSSDATKLANARAWFTNHWDLEATLTSTALLEWMSIWDDAAQNHFFWRRADGRWTRLGWDYDNVMSTTTSGGGGGPGGGGPGGGGGGPGGGSSQTIYGGEYGATTVFDGVNWWKDTFYKCFRTEYQQRLWELNNSFFDPTNLTALGLTRAATFAKARQAYVNTQLASFGTYTKPNRPSNVYPADGASVSSATNLVTSAYSHPQSVLHQSTRWEIRSASGDYEEPVWRVTSTNDLISLPIPFDQLTYGQTYYWRATHLDNVGRPSVVSTETRFVWGVAANTAGILVLNEVLAYNRNTLQNGTEFPDYIELRNNGSVDLDLSGYALGENPAHPSKFTFPTGTTIPASGHLLVWCDNDTTAPGLHSGFGLDAEGQTLLLMNGTILVDSVTFGPQAPDVSIGRISNGTGGWQANTPTPGLANIAQTLGSVSDLRLNEWMADPAYGEDWFEIYNPGTDVVALAGLWLSDTPSSPRLTQIPPLSFIAPHGFTRFWADGKASGAAHADFRLDSAGDSLVLTAVNGIVPIDTVTFGTQDHDSSQGRLPDGSATIASFSARTASPGYGNWAPSPVVINEVLANASSPFEDAIELFNTAATPVDVGGWWLSDDLLEPKKYVIPAGTRIPAGGYLVIYENQMRSGTVPFALEARGDEVLLTAVDSSGVPTGSSSLVRFGASAENTSFGRIAATGLGASSSGVEFWPLVAPTFGQSRPSNVAAFRTGTGASNASPRIGPVVINEIMLHPPDLADGANNTQAEFVELRNITDGSVDLSGWRFKGDAEFRFPSGATLSANGYALLVSFDPADALTLAAFRATYGLTSATPVYGPYSESLANSTFDVELAYPATVGGGSAFLLLDKVEYRDRAPWPAGADGEGGSLQRLNVTTIGNTAANWTAGTPTPGAANVGSDPAIGSIMVTRNTITLEITGHIGVNYTVEISTNLVDWTLLGTTNALTMPVTWTQALEDPTSSSGFFRVRIGP